MTPLVLVHGFLGGSAQWDGQIAALSDVCDVIALDLPGFGDRADETPIASIDGFAEWVIAELEHNGVHRCHLLGHSMGGMIVQEVVHRAPKLVETLILYATGSVGVLPGRFETIAESKRRAREEGAEATARRIAATWFKDGATARGYPGCADIAAKASLAAMEAGLDAMEGWSGVDRLAGIRQETFIIWGDKDRTYSRSQIDLLHRKIPETTLTVIRGCAHAVHLEEPEVFNACLRRHLESRS